MGASIWEASTITNQTVTQHLNVGLGKMLFKDLRTYEGDWLLGKMHGKGVFTWPNGKKYSGEYVEGKK